MEYRAVTVTYWNTADLWENGRMHTIRPKARTPWAIAVAAAAALGCMDEPDHVPDDPSAGGVRIQMDFDSDAAFWAAPWPSEHRRHDDGIVDIAAFPNPDEIPFIDALIGEVDGVLDGFGATSTIYLTSEAALDAAAMPDVWRSVEEDSPVFLIGVEPGGTGRGVRIPIDATYLDDGGPFGADRMLALLPLQGRPLAPDELYAAVVMRALGDHEGERLATMETADLPEAYDDALAELDELGIDAADIAGMAVFRTQDVGAQMDAMTAAAHEHVPAPTQVFELTDTFEDFCVYQSVLPMPVYQEGDPPYLTGGGGIAWDDAGSPVLQRYEDARIVVTIPRSPMPDDGWPTAVFIRTGAGGDRPLVDRGVRAEPGGEAIEPGSGAARYLAWGGLAGVSVDGPHGGLRNVTGGDEQFLIFNITNPAAMRDNLRQSAAELTLLPDVLAELDLDVSACDGAGGGTFDTAGLALMGHSMGATIAPLALASDERYTAAVLSGAGGSWIHNIVYKLSPLEVRPMAEAVLGYDEGELDTTDPALALLQWAGESADPPPFGALRARGTLDILVVQGIVDTYILPPMANATSLSHGLDLAGEALDAVHPELAQFRSIEALLGLAGGERIDLPVAGNADGRTAVVVQHPEDGIEDGHEAWFQTEAPKHQTRCFLESWIAGAAEVPVGGIEADACE